ncbi:MAG TPA: hypothetical protein VJU84_04040 [Pyrinomonadaceae bacterium]|nr:hypothetical protein [Pyrinomonadaceae bacterium]
MTSLNSLGVNSVSGWRRIPIVLCLLSGLSGQSCVKKPMSAECSEFFSRQRSERESLFKKYDLELQLRLYRCGLNRRPPDTSLAIYIAEKGEAVVPALLSRLEMEKDELVQFGIIDIFHVMAIKGHLRGRSDITDIIRQAVSKMKIRPLREMANERLNEFEKNISLKR